MIATIAIAHVASQTHFWWDLCEGKFARTPCVFFLAGNLFGPEDSRHLRTVTRAFFSP
jgi:hypothetical protein